jgi:UDP-N-acetyl-D-mannosaminuronic acid dehydrogenase
MKLDKKICVIGLGYIGLPSAALLASRGYEVLGVDTVQEIVDIINSGNIHIAEPELDIFVRAAVQSGLLKTDIKPSFADIFIITVPTPLNEGHKPNISYIISATESLVPYLKAGNMVILESTSPVGTTERVCEILEREGVDTGSLAIAYCPERVLPGHIMKELVENDRIIGGITEKAACEVKKFYDTFIEGEIFLTDARTAEMVKLVENSFRDVNIAFANELSILCDRFKVDVWELIRLANKHPRVSVLSPGCGVGGHCIAIDPWFLVDTGGDEAELIRAARVRNLYKTEWVIEKIKNEILLFEREHKKAPTVACMGLSYKADIDDLRESPALFITKRLLNDNYHILAVEPNVQKIEDITIVDYREAVDKADILVFLVAHREFRDINVNYKIVMDFCGVTMG